MNAQLNVTMPYGRGSSPIQTDKGIEFDALASVTRQLKAGSIKEGKGFHILCAAVHRNRQLWTALAADVADSENGLSKELRSRVFYLSEFVNKHSRLVLRRKENADALVYINVAVMRGLSPSDHAS